MECNDKSMQSSLHASEYEVVDPWEEDRKEAMKQLYPDNYTDDNNDTDDYGQKTEQMTKVNAKSSKLKITKLLNIIQCRSILKYFK